MHVKLIQMPGKIYDLEMPQGSTVLDAIREAKINTSDRLWCLDIVDTESPTGVTPLRPESILNEDCKLLIHLGVCGHKACNPNSHIIETTP